MKTNLLHWWALGVTVSGFSLMSAGCRENKAAAQAPVLSAAPTAAQPAVTPVAATPIPAEAPPPAPAEIRQEVATPSPPPPAPIIITNPTPPAAAPAAAAAAAPAPTNAPAQVVQEATMPEEVAVSPALGKR